MWLLRDAKGSVATELRDNGVVIGQRAYDPYGAPDAGGSSKTQGENHSTLGFQAAHTDDVSGRILLGERQYDPTTERFTTPDVYIGSGADLSLGTDPLTGNRYIFAAANPTAFYDDGHGPLCGEDQQICKSHTTKKAVNRRNQQARESRATTTSSGFTTTTAASVTIAPDILSVLNDSVGGLVDGLTTIPFTETSLMAKLREHMVESGLAVDVNQDSWDYEYAERIGRLEQLGLAILAGGPVVSSRWFKRNIFFFGRNSEGGPVVSFFRGAMRYVGNHNWKYGEIPHMRQIELLNRWKVWRF